VRVVVVGATGFIGRAVTAALIDSGLDVVVAVRRVYDARRRFPSVEAWRVDLARPRDAGRWERVLKGADAVVNCAGVLDRDAEAVHVQGTLALFEGCRAAGVRRIVHISAISADEAAGTGYAATKRKADEALARMDDIEWTIFRPSLVYGPGAYGGTALMRGLAALPALLPVPGDGLQRFSPIFIDDLARAVHLALASDRFVRRAAEPCGPEDVTFEEYLRRIQAWLGLKPTRTLRLPMPLVRALVCVVNSGPVSPTALAQVEYGNAGDGAAFAEAAGFRPASMAEVLETRPASGQDRAMARAYFLPWLVWPTAGLAALGAALWAFGLGPWLLLGSAAMAMTLWLFKIYVGDDR